jgi:cobalamin synthase
VNFVSQFARHYLLAVQFFTRIPVTGPLAGWVGFSPAMLRASAAHFPGVGWLVAAVACSVYAARCVAAACQRLHSFGCRRGLHHRHRTAHRRLS